MLNGITTKTYHEAGAVDSLFHDFSIDIEFDNGLTFGFFVEMEFTGEWIEDAEAEVKVTLVHDDGTEEVVDPAAWGIEQTIEDLKYATANEIACAILPQPDPYEEHGVRRSDF